jgi:hypothetical protein
MATFRGGFLLAKAAHGMAKGCASRVTDGFKEVLMWVL